MNIAYIVPEFVTEVKGGGLASYINNIAQILAAKGHKITIIVKSAINESLIYRQNIVVERTYVDISEVDVRVPGSYYCEWSRVLNQKLNDLHKLERFDIAQYANWNALALYRTEIPTVVRISSDLPHWRAANTLEYIPQKRYCCEKIVDYLEDLALMHADTVFSPSFLLAGIISERTGTSVEILESPFERKNIKENDTLYLDRLLNKNYLLTFGNLNLLKGSKLIGDIIYDILSKYQNLNYVFAGNDHGWKGEHEEHVSAIDYIRKCAAEYADRIIYLGALDREILYPVIRNSLFCVMPSRIDNFPNACVEAMSFGKVVIGTNGASFEQLLCDGKSGILIERENPDALKRAINQLLQMTCEERNRIGLCAIDRTKNLCAEIIADKTIALYQETIEKGRTNTFNLYYKQLLNKCAESYR